MNNMRNWSVAVALSGFLFGFDTVVISGANLPIRELWNTSAWFHGIFIMSMALWGTVIGALCGGIPCNKYGRKKTLFWIGILYLVSALGSGMAPDPYSFSFFRFIGGLGVGASSVAAPTYISEISGAKNRGKLVALYQFNLVFGILLAYISNFLLQGVGGNNDWRFMLAVEAIPAAIYCLMVWGVPNSPRWLLLQKQDEAGAREVLQKMYDNEEAEKALDQIRLDNTPGKTHNVFSGKYGLPLLLAFLIAFFNQLSGINFILYYAPEILEMAGLASKDSLMNAIAIGAINLVFTLLGLRLIDSLGRKQLMLIGSLGYIISLTMVAWSFYASASPVVLLIFILLFIASHAIGQGAVIWVFISEIFPNKVRAYGQAFGSGVHWVFAALITLLAPVFIDMFRENPWPIFAFFAFMMVLQLFFTIFLMPETKGVSLEELEKRMIKED
ncbi:MFS transporter [Sinomicrobium pectinilyticum]|uniref:MFS transporter n=1 Tax=Sinomicrobium pectinilyticum TaxID=1084421 RepID=A0A3N0CX90_SINP1|nr:sugar porter family MFS transporter [Sinomicrobium pectinilyticum]RNL68048.1 MFS transporter [Sinomicrobium pectinilyticum]